MNRIFVFTFALLMCVPEAYGSGRGRKVSDDPRDETSYAKRANPATIEENGSAEEGDFVLRRARELGDSAVQTPVNTVTPLPESPPEEDSDIDSASSPFNDDHRTPEDLTQILVSQAIDLDFESFLENAIDFFRLEESNIDDETLVDLIDDIDSLTATYEEFIDFYINEVRSLPQTLPAVTPAAIRPIINSFVTNLYKQQIYAGVFDPLTDEDYARTLMHSARNDAAELFLETILTHERQHGTLLSKEDVSFILMQIPKILKVHLALLKSCMNSIKIDAEQHNYFPTNPLPFSRYSKFTETLLKGIWKKIAQSHLPIYRHCINPRAARKFSPPPPSPLHVKPPKE
jgi:hypothetical protein